MDEKMLKRIEDGRQYRSMTVEIAGESEDMVVKGYASTFEQPYDLYSFKDKNGARHQVREVISRDAFHGADMSDVIMQYDHTGRVFARRSNGTLQITEDDHGLKIVADLSGTTLGRQLYEEIQGGYTNKMSFGFSIADDDTVPDGADYLHTIRKIGKLYDVSAVSLPANDFTEISARSQIDGAIAEIEAERLQAEEEAKRLEQERESLRKRIEALKGEMHGD